MSVLPEQRPSSATPCAACLQVRDQLQEAKLHLKELARHSTGGGSSASSQGSTSRPGSASGSATPTNPLAAAAAATRAPPPGMAPPGVAAAGRGRGAGGAYNPLAAAGARPAYNPLAAQQAPAPQQFVPGYSPAATAPAAAAGRGLGSLPAMPLPGGRGRGAAAGRGGYRPPGLAYQGPGYAQPPGAAYPPGWAAPPPRQGPPPPPPPAGAVAAIQFKAPTMPMGFDEAVRGRLVMCARRCSAAGRRFRCAALSLDLGAGFSPETHGPLPTAAAV